MDLGFGRDVGYERAIGNVGYVNARVRKTKEILVRGLDHCFCLSSQAIIVCNVSKPLAFPPPFFRFMEMVRKSKFTEKLWVKNHYLNILLSK